MYECELNSLQQLRNLRRELRFYGEALDNAVDVATVSRVRLLVETPDTTINASAIEDTAQELLNLHTDVVQLQQSVIARCDAAMVRVRAFVADQQLVKNMVDLLAG